MDEEYKNLINLAYYIKKIEYGFTFLVGGRPVELTIRPHIEICKGDVLLSACYSLSVSGYSYTYGQGLDEDSKKDVAVFGKMYEMLEQKYKAQIKKGKGSIYDFVKSLKND